MNSQEQFETQYEKDKPMYLAWGNFVKDYIFQQLNLSLVEYNKLIKIPVEPRVKETASLVQKAFFRNKSYKDPYNDIMDKVGIRFVVMVTCQIKRIAEIVENSKSWSWSKDKDYEAVREQHPEVFEYESVHYVVKANEDFKYNYVEIKKDTPCEIQIRTLEQHAYAELSHDYFYKSNYAIENKMKRCLARSSALNEMTDLMFKEVYDMIENEKEEYYKLNTLLENIYAFKDYDEELNRSIYNSIKSMYEKYVLGKIDLTEWVKKEEDILKYIEKRKKNSLYKQPMIILLYFLLSQHRKELINTWEYTEDMLEPIADDLGISLDI